MTALFIAIPGKLTYEPGAIRAPAGEAEMVVHFVGADERWQEIGRFPIRIRTRAGFEKASFDPRFDIGNEGQVAEGHAPLANQPPRDTYQDFSGNAGFTTVHARNGWTVQSQMSIAGVSNRVKALRFAQEGAKSPAGGLWSTASTWKRASRSFRSDTSPGEGTGTSSTPSAAAAPPSHCGSAAGPILTAAWLHGSTIVGWSHFLGFDQRQHRLGGGTLGIEAFPSHPGVLRLEATAITGSLLPIAGFTQGAVNDAEKSRGWGMRLVAATPNQRGRLEAGYSRSRFDNPADPLLDQGAAIVEVRETTRAARYVEAGFDVVRAWPITPPSRAG